MVSAIVRYELSGSTLVSWVRRRCVRYAVIALEAEQGVCVDGRETALTSGELQGLFRGDLLEPQVSTDGRADRLDMLSLRERVGPDEGVDTPPLPAGI